ncbi:tetratricopeptide repeat protein [Pararhizobium mangrovi]|uniref:Ancillary SecYEG translocon subunit n=1 Tax=Pararhizobium mangrovi TaxID=2590452 RepID=A0A506U224_9HYPH|nr:tetratricopeptide repeat protein [Pararhizobium mangrovi]TPW25917.1 tetratricopeptide repeat protein [Pararhizobium mangrovi]
MAHDESFFREVREDLRNERFKQLWNRFGIYLIAALVVLILAIGAYVGYRYWSERQSAQSGDAFAAALSVIDDGKTDQALGDLDKLADTGYGDYPALARLRAAGLMAENGKTDDALKAFKAVANDDDVPQAIRDVARVRGGLILVDHGTYGDAADMVQTLTGDDDPFRNSAREILGLSAWKAGDMKQARTWFEKITSDNQAERGVVQQAQMMLDLIDANTKPA